MDEQKPIVVILNFGCTITHPQLDALLSHCPGELWEMLAIPEEAKDRVMAALEKALAEGEQRP
jgi:hypothetical protein